MENYTPQLRKKEDFKYEFVEDIENDDEYEKTLEKDIEINCELSVYVNKLELEEKSDSELILMEKQDIIDFKNYQIQKYKAYIFSLEKEKEDLIENFKNTTNVLIDKIKELEFRDSGVRPETPFITKKINQGRDRINQKSKINNENNFSHRNNNSINIQKYNSAFGMERVDKQISTSRCPHCTKEFSQEIFLQHSLDCLRNKIRCKKCNELIDEKYKKEHLLEWRSKDKLQEAISTKSQHLLQKCLDHGAPINKIIDEETGDTLLHLLSRTNNIKMLESIINTELNINPTNKNFETPLLTAINQGQNKMAKFLIDIGADITKRNLSDMSALMLACRKGIKEIVEYLILNKADINEKAAISGQTPLSCCKDEELALFLMQNGAKITTQSQRENRENRTSSSVINMNIK